MDSCFNLSVMERSLYTMYVVCCRDVTLQTDKRGPGVVTPTSSILSPQLSIFTSGERLSVLTVTLFSQVAIGFYFLSVQRTRLGSFHEDYFYTAIFFFDLLSQIWSFFLIFICRQTKIKYCTIYIIVWFIILLTFLNIRKACLNSYYRWWVGWVSLLGRPT